MIERERKRQDAGTAAQTISRLDPGEAAIGGRATNRAAGVTARAAEHEASWYGGAGAARRTAGEPRRVPGVARRRPRQVEARPAEGEFVRRQLAHDDSAGFLELENGEGI